MEMGDIEGPASGQIIPGEASVLSDAYTAKMSMEEVNLRNVLLELKKLKLDSLDNVYGMLDHYCELRRIQKDLPDGDLQETEFRARVAERVGQFKTMKILMARKKQQELESKKCKIQK